MKPITIGKSITNREDASLGIYLKDVSKQSMVDINEEIDLARKIQQGNKQALDKLVRANLRFAISIAKQYQNKGLSLVDLIQEASFGLIEAAKRYDPDKGFKFISYAVWWIRQSIIQALSNQCRTIRIPMSQVVSINKINKAIQKLEQIYGREPSIEELSQETNISSDKITIALVSSNRTLSLDVPIKNDEECSNLVDVIPNESTKNPDNNLLEKEVSNELNNILNNLSLRERDILRMSFGLGMTPMQYEEIGARFGIGYERVRQIQQEALCRLKLNYKNELKDLL